MSVADGRRIVEIVEGAFSKERERILQATSFLIFGPGKGNEGYGLREAMRESLNSFGCTADFAESILNGTAISPVSAERILTNLYDVVPILLVGLGPALEFAHYIKEGQYS